MSVCSYIVIHARDRYVGSAGAALHWQSSLAFRWEITIDDESHEREVSVRADNASERGVPLPAAWQNAMRCSDLSSRAEAACLALESVDGVSEVTCSLIGVPKPCCTPSGDEPCPGTILALHARSSGRLNFVLVAHIHGSRWFCHAGSFEVSEPGAPARGRLDEAALVVKDIAADICGERPAKRIRQHARHAQLRELIGGSPDAWRTLVALATIKAEHKRAEMHGRDPDWHVALACFEKSPWRWAVAEDRPSHVRVYFLWTWYDAARAGYAYEVTSLHLNNVLARGAVPPPGLHLRDLAMQAGLEAYALDQFRRTGCPCRYLGALVDGKSQAHPSLWGAATAESKGKTIVFFQWEHVTVGQQKKPLLVGMSVDNALYNRRPLPRWPLRSRSQGIYFSIEWLSAFADWKKPGTTYHGI